MIESDNMERLNKISSVVSERDKKIWENMAYSIAIRKQIEKLQNEISHIKAATAERKKKNDNLENQLEELSNTLKTQKQTLQASEQSVILQKYLKESVTQEANDLRKKYAEALEMYNDELKDYQAIYENASQSYKDLRTQQIRLKKLEIEKMDLNVKIANLERKEKEFGKIQKLIFQKAVVKFAKIYTLYHKNEKLRLEVQAKKKVEQQLLKEHLQLSEAVKQKKRSEQSKTKSQIKIDNKPSENPIAVKENSESTCDNELKKFLEEEILPCSLTSINSPKNILNFSQDHSKVKILDVKLMRPQIFKPAVKKPNLDLRKKMQDIMETAKKDALRNNSFQINSTNSLNSQKVQTKTIFTPPGSQSSQTGSQQNQKQANPSLQKRPEIQSNSQIAAPTPKVEMSQSKIIVEKHLTPKESVTGSILKPPSQTFSEKNETNVQNVSKFFSSKKKTVTFQTESPKEISNFQLFGDESKKAETAKVEMNVFRNSFLFKNDTFLKPEELTGARNSGSDNAVSDLTNNASFTMETGPTFSTTGGENADKNPDEFSFDLLNVSTHRGGFGPSGLNTELATEITPFSFIGSQTKSNNPFSFF
ncbi:microtubule organizer protein 1-like [Tribolium madens]|uniref:microtubule organizer protein 1-like n=1 Tax=Tribolium madens TaxID=41895 RepID=UPI001CF71FB2|nr:microtubule organizer protein 1-like [Tribolium madens]